MKALFVLFLLQTAAADFVFRYTKSQGVLKPPYISISVGQNPEKFDVALDFNRPHSFAFDPVCKDRYKCDNRDHPYVYDPKKTGGKALGKKFSDQKYYFTNYTGELYDDTVNVGDLKIPVDFGAVTSGFYVATYTWDGALGLGLDNSRTNVVLQLLRKLSVKQIVLQEGEHPIKRPNRETSWSTNGTITFGRYTGNMCGQFTFYDTRDDQSWQIVTDVTIGNETLKNQIVAFLSGRMSELPIRTFAKYFPERENENEDNYPDIGFKLKGKEYKITKDDYSFYTSGEKYSVFLSTTPQANYDFGFGSDLLQHYCLAIRASSDFKKLQIGLAENRALK